MKFSKKTEYAVRALVEMALRLEGGTVWMQISQIAQSTNIPEKFLEQILLNLKNGGFLKSRRGIEGGYALNQGPQEIPIGQIVKLLEGGTSGGKISSESGDDDDVNQAYSELVQKAEQVFDEVLNSCTLADMVAKIVRRREARARNSEYQI